MDSVEPGVKTTVWFLVTDASIDVLFGAELRIDSLNRRRDSRDESASRTCAGRRLSVDKNASRFGKIDQEMDFIAGNRAAGASDRGAVVGSVGRTGMSRRGRFDDAARTHRSTFIDHATAVA